MRKRVVVTGLGCISPLGNSVEDTWGAILEGKSGAGLITHFDASEHKCKIAAEVKDFNAEALFGQKEARRMDRFSQFILACALQAKESSQLRISDDNRERIGAVIGSGIGGLNSFLEQTEVYRSKGPNRVSPFTVPMMLPDTGGALVAIHFGIHGPNMAVVTACATGTNAIGEAAELIRRGDADVMFAGGSEAAINTLAVAGMAAMTALSTRNDEPERASRPFDRERDGFLMGEGGAILILESLEHAKNREASILAEIKGYGSTNDGYHITAPVENGAGAAKCMQLALNNAQLNPSNIGYINAHGTSTPLNDKCETQAIKTVFGDLAYDIPVSSTKSMTGHLLGGAGAIEALFCIKSLLDNILPPTINYEFPDPECDLDYVPNKPRPANVDHVMSNSFGFGGHNATIILSRYQMDD
jgi:3-oxoacyl-[acyl-carrier-protein] synthase II